MILDSKNIVLRPIKLTDAARIAELANNQKISMNLRDGFPHPYTLADAEKFIMNCQNQDPVTFFAIDWKGKQVGNISLVVGTDVYRKSAEIGYFIGEPYWNRGIATSAIKLITEYGFDKLGLIRIHTGVFEYNTASQHVLEKCGFQKEAIFRRSIFKNGQIWDEIRYALINPAFDKA
jgi:ribosomal-protein-alanine N-acetyltransferase